MVKGLEIDFETADRITLITLQDQLKYLKKDVKNHEKKGSWMHPEDYQMNKVVLIPALEVLIKYYGG